MRRFGSKALENAVRLSPGRIFFGVVEGWFFRGFVGKTVFLRGVFVVKLW